jgi:magnesium-transporting ATPase (P-type)
VRIAADLGILNTGTPVLPGNELDKLDDATFAAAVLQTSVFARIAQAQAAHRASPASQRQRGGDDG